MASLRKRDKIYYIRFQRRRNGEYQGITHSLQTTRKEIALKKKLELEEDYREKRKDPFLPGFKIEEENQSQTFYTLNDARKAFQKSKMFTCRERTVDAYMEVIDHFTRFHSLEETSADLVSKKQLEDFLYRNGIKDSTRKSNKQKLKTFFLWMVDQNILENEPVSKIPIAKPDSTTYSSMMSDQEFHLLLSKHESRQQERRKAKNFHDWQEQRWFRPLMQIYRHTSVRRDEGVRLKGKHIVDMEFVHIGFAKGHRERLIPINEELKNELKLYFKQRGVPGPEEYLFPNPKFSTNHISGRRAWEVFREVRIASKIPKGKHIHGFRHKGITEWIEMGFSTSEAAMMAGHHSTSVTDGYTHLVANNLKDKMNKLHKLKEDNQ